MAAMLPVYLFTGFLEGGKTHVIQESMEVQFGGKDADSAMRGRH